MKRHTHCQAHACAKHQRAAAPAKQGAAQRQGLVMRPGACQVQLHRQQPDAKRHGSHDNAASSRSLCAIGGRRVWQHDGESRQRCCQRRHERRRNRRGYGCADLPMQAKLAEPKPRPQPNAKNGRAGDAPVAAFCDRRAPRQTCRSVQCGKRGQPSADHANSSSAIWKSLCMRAHPARPPDLRPAPSLCFAARIAQKPVVSGREKARLLRAIHRMRRDHSRIPPRIKQA